MIFKGSKLGFAAFFLLFLCNNVKFHGNFSRLSFYFCNFGAEIKNN